MAASWTQADLDALESAIATGAKRVEYGDKKVEYRSMAEMLQARTIIQNSLGIVTTPQRQYATFSKGLTPGESNSNSDNTF